MAKVRVVNKGQNSDLIGGNFNNIASETIFNFGRFNLTTNFTGKETIDYSNELSSFVRPITLETLNVDEELSTFIVDFTTNARLNLDQSDLKSYIRFGSTRELLRVAIEQVIEKYPASLFANSQLRAFGSITVQNYVFDPLINECEFITPSDFLVNNFNLIFDAGNTSTPNDNALKNLNISFSSYNIWRVDNPDDETHTILGFTGDSSGSPFIRVRAFGNPFPELTGTTNSSAISYHLKPQPAIYNRFKLELNQLESYLLDNRLEDRSGFSIKLKEPSSQDTGQIIYTPRKYLWSTSDGYNIEINTSTYQRFFDSILNLGQLYDETKTDLIARFLTPESLKLYDLTDEGKITKLLRIYGAEFDQIRAFIDGIVTINKVSYDKIKNVPDQLVKNLARTLGWDTFTLIDEEQFTNTFFNIEQEEGKDDLLPAEVDIELWRRILINTNYFWKSKGTSKALEAILLLIGIPPTFINITEYIYTVDGRIDPNSVTLSLEDLPSASLPYDSEGYPIAPAEDDDFYFQISGNADSGQAYIDLYRNLGFNVNRIIDNKKSWVQEGFVERIDNTTPNYFQQDSRLILNTKEIDATLDIAQAIEFDVFCYNKFVDAPITSTGVTIPYLFVNVDISYPDDTPTWIFPLPEAPLSASSVQLNFNGITLTPTGATDISGNTLGVGDYYVSADTSNNYFVILVDPANAAQTYSNGEKDVISVTYLFDQLGTDAFREVKYIVQRPNVTASGTILDMGTEPKGDVQLVVNGVSLTKSTSLFTGDFIIDPNDRTKIIVQNTELSNYLNFGSPVLRIWLIEDGATPSTAEKRSEAFRVDSFNSKVEYDSMTDQYSYAMDFAAFDAASIKVTINGITLRSNEDYTLDTFNKSKILFATSIDIKIGDIVGVYYIISDESYIPPLLPPDPTFPDISEMSFLEYLELIQRRLVPVQIRKTISDFKGGYYPTILGIYEEYLRRSFLPEDNPLHSNGYTFAKLYPFINKYNAFFSRFLNQLLPATIIARKSGILIRNTIFTKQKFMYRRGVNFDERLQYLGDNGAEYRKILPESDCDWSNDFVCVTATTTTTTTTVAPTATTTTTTVAPTTTTTTTIGFLDFTAIVNELSNNGVSAEYQISYSGQALASISSIDLNFDFDLENTVVAGGSHTVSSQYDLTTGGTTVFSDTNTSDTILLIPTRTITVSLADDVRFTLDVSATQGSAVSVSALARGVLTSVTNVVSINSYNTSVSPTGPDQSINQIVQVTVP